MESWAGAWGQDYSFSIQDESEFCLSSITAKKPFTYAMLHGWTNINCEYCFQNYGVVVALDIVFTSNVY